MFYSGDSRNIHPLLSGVCTQELLAAFVPSFVPHGDVVSGKGLTAHVEPSKFGHRLFPAKYGTLRLFIEFIFAEPTSGVEQCVGL